MKKTTLRFTNLEDLIQFQKTIDMTSYRINASAILLTGNFSEEEVNLAKEKYSGYISQTEHTLQEFSY